MAWLVRRARIARGLGISTALLLALLFASGEARAGQVASLYLNVSDNLVGYGGDWTALTAAPVSLSRFVALTVIPRVDSPSGVDVQTILASGPIIGLATSALPGDPGATTIYIGKPQNASTSSRHSGRHASRSSRSQSQHLGNRHGRNSQRAAAKLLKWLQKNPNASLDVIVSSSNGYFEGLLAPISATNTANFEIDDSITGLLTPGLPACEPVPELIIADVNPPSSPSEPQIDSLPDPVGDTQPPVHAPEPASITLLLTGLTSLAVSRRRKAA